jgi:prepilin-type N-terminal cleavage/methylation domain-containing protein/prepilin-type processing-associated H-X9-DG protein
MGIQDISRWMWFAIGAVVGLLFFAIHWSASEDWKQYGELINQRQFEGAMRKIYGGQPGFRNLLIYPQRIQDVNGIKTIYLISGEYTDREEMRDGRLEGNWQRKCFLAASPYRPLAMGPLQPEPVDSVITYLSALRQSYPGISWRIAWWNTAFWTASLWIGSWVLGLGVIWPCVINLIYYRRLLRPFQPKGMDLSQVGSEPPAPPRPTPVAQDLERMQELEATIEGNLASEAQTRPRTAPGSPQPAAVARLTATALEPVAVEQDGQEKEFGKKKDDFYPTERHGAPSSADGHDAGPAPRRGGFTLVELLVVIGIIAIIIGLLMPAVAGARIRARELQCQTTLRNIGMAAQLHVNDHRGNLPLVGWAFNPVGGEVNPEGLGDSERNRYVYYDDRGQFRPLPLTASLVMCMDMKLRTDSRENLAGDLQKDSVRRLFYCPSQEVQAQGVTIGDQRGWETPPEWSSYIFNEAALARRNQPYAFPQGRLTKIKQPSMVFMAMDGKPRGGFFTVFDMDQNYTMKDFQRLMLEQPNLGPDPLDYLRHRYRANVLFLDFHVENVPLTEEGLDLIGISRGIY